MTSAELQHEFVKQLETASDHRHMVDVSTDAVGMFADVFWSPFAMGRMDEVERVIFINRKIEK